MRPLLESSVAVLMLVLLSPLLLVVAVMIAVTSGWPVLFSQARVGLHGRDFRLFKFRSMVIYDQKTGDWSTSTNDSRITPIGKILRASSLDELPQLWNIAIGDMSFIGPRPDVPQQRSLYTNEEWRTRHSVRPGITGLAQATLRSDATPEQRKALDLQYVKENSVGLNVSIVFKTIQQVVLRRGTN